MTRPEGAAIWDVDGTLVDTAELHYRAWVELAAEIGKPFTRADFAATFGRRNPEIIRALFDPAAADAVVADLGRDEVRGRAVRRPPPGRRAAGRRGGPRRRVPDRPDRGRRATTPPRHT